MYHVDYLSRLDEDTETNEKNINHNEIYQKYGIKIKNDNILKNHFISNEYLLMKEKLNLIKDFKLIEVPHIKERKNIIESIHEQTGHMGFNIVYQNIKNKYFWKVITNAIKNTCKKCQICLKYNIKENRSYQHVESSYPNQIIGLDLLNSKKDIYIVLLVDNFSRYAHCKVIPTRESKEFLKVVGFRVRTHRRFR